MTEDEKILKLLRKKPEEKPDPFEEMINKKKISKFEMDELFCADGEKEE